MESIKKEKTPLNKTQSYNDNLKQEMEQKYHVDMSNVVIHYNSDVPAKFHAGAMAGNDNIYMRSGKQQHLRHEMHHIVQQKKQLVEGKHKHKGAMFNTDIALEQNNIPIQQHKKYTSPVYQFCRESFTQKEIKAIADKENCHFGKKEKPGLKRRILSFANNSLLLNDDVDGEKTIANLHMIFHILAQDFDLTEPIFYILDTMQNPQQALQAITLLDNRNKIKVGLRGSRGIKTPESLIIIEKEYISLQQIAAYIGDQHTTQFYKLLADLRNVCEEKSIEKVVEGCNNNVTTNILNPLYNPPSVFDANLFMKRLSLTTSFILDVAKKVGTTYFIEPTGSDPHENGSQALFLVSKTDGKKIVYKPHSLYIDDFVTGQDSILSMMNEYMPGTELPTMQIQPKEHTEEFIHKTGESGINAVNLHQAKMFFYKLGELQLISYIFGITDLHADNIMFSKDGPIITDAECALMRYNDDMIEHSHVAVLLATTVGMQTEYANALFFINHEGTIISSVDAYKMNVEGCKLSFEQGYNSLLLKMRMDQNIIMQNYENLLNRQCDHIQLRVVPLTTQEFGDALVKFPYKNVEEQQKCIETLTIECIKSMKLFVISEISRGFILQLYKKHIFNVIEQDFRLGIIPAITFDMKKGVLRMGRQKIGNVTFAKSDGVQGYDKTAMIHALVGKAQDTLVSLPPKNLPL